MFIFEFQTINQTCTVLKARPSKNKIEKCVETIYEECAVTRQYYVHILAKSKCVKLNNNPLYDVNRINYDVNRLNY